ncbi:MAG: hypothetical protein ABI298_02990 [Acidimicrobiales bacterium]
MFIHPQGRGWAVDRHLWLPAPVVALVGDVVVITFTLNSRTEELRMCEAFPNEYPDYRRRVKSVVLFLL